MACSILIMVINSRDVFEQKYFAKLKRQACSVFDCYKCSNIVIFTLMLISEKSIDVRLNLRWTRGTTCSDAVVVSIGCESDRRNIKGIFRRKGHTTVPVLVPPCCLHNDWRFTMSFIFTQGFSNILALWFPPIRLWRPWLVSIGELQLELLDIVCKRRQLGCFESGTAFKV